MENEENNSLAFGNLSPYSKINMEMVDLPNFGIYNYMLNWMNTIHKYKDYKADQQVKFDEIVENYF